MAHQNLAHTSKPMGVGCHQVQHSQQQELNHQGVFSLKVGRGNLKHDIAKAILTDSG
jgi:hypothetical protein